MPKRLSRLRGAAASLVALGLVLAACEPANEDPEESLVPVPTQTAEPSAIASASASASPPDDGEETSVFDLEEGDCFSASGDQVESVTVVDCDQPHIYEVFAVFDHESGEDDPYPGDEELLQYADAACQPLFEDYVATDYEDSAYWITSVTPSPQTWDEGDDREIVCALKLGEEGSETTGSAEGTGQ